MPLDHWLKLKRMTQAEFAALIGVDPSTITRIIPGDGKRQSRRPSFELMAAIMRATTDPDTGQPAVTANDFLADATATAADTADTGGPVTPRAA